MVLKPVGTQNTPKKQYNMDTRIAKIRQKYHDCTMTLRSLSK